VVIQRLNAASVSQAAVSRMIDHVDTRAKVSSH
jgi:hypothetical protein